MLQRSLLTKRMFDSFSRQRRVRPNPHGVYGQLLLGRCHVYLSSDLIHGVHFLLRINRHVRQLVQLLQDRLRRLAITDVLLGRWLHYYGVDHLAGHVRDQPLVQLRVPVLVSRLTIAASTFATATRRLCACSRNLRGRRLLNHSHVHIGAVPAVHRLNGYQQVVQDHLRRIESKPDFLHRKLLHYDRTEPRVGRFVRILPKYQRIVVVQLHLPRVNDTAFASTALATATRWLCRRAQDVHGRHVSVGHSNVHKRALPAVHLCFGSSIRSYRTSSRTTTH